MGVGAAPAPGELALTSGDRAPRELLPHRLERAARRVVLGQRAAAPHPALAPPGRRAARAVALGEHVAVDDDGAAVERDVPDPAVAAIAAGDVAERDRRAGAQRVDRDLRE